MSKMQFFANNDPLKSVKIEFDSLLKHPSTVTLLKICLVSIGLAWILFGIFYQYFPPQIPLFFSKPWGTSQLVAKSYLILIPASITLLFFINVRFAGITFKRDILMSLTLLWTQLIICALALTTLFRLILLLT